MANQPDLIPSAWAVNNTSTENIPATTTVIGKASWDQGFPTETGIPLSQGGVPPRYGDFNGILNVLSQFCLFAQAGGQFTWVNSLDYSVGSIVVGSDGSIYRAAQVSGPSTTAVNPVGDTSGNWSRIVSKSEIDALEADIQTAMTNAADAMSNASAAQSAVSTLDANVVKLSGDQTIAGVKSFTSSPIVEKNSPNITLNRIFEGTPSSPSDVRFTNNGTNEAVIRLTADNNLQIGAKGDGASWYNGPALILNKDNSFSLRSGYGGTTYTLIGSADGKLYWKNRETITDGGDQIVGGTKTFSSTIVGNITGNAGSATADGNGNNIVSTYQPKSVKATGTSTARNIADRFADIVNLKDFGAKGDGTTNDTTAWNAFLAASGGLKYIPAGQYKINGTIKNFGHGSIGLPKAMSFANRFPAIPVGENHLFYSSRDLTISDSFEGLAIAPTLSIDALVDASGTNAINNNGSLLSSCHGIYVQHKQTGGSADNQLATTGIVVSAENAAAGDNDCSGVAARSRKNNIAGGIGDCAGIGGRIDNYSEQLGGTMGAEFVAYNHASGMPRPSDYSWVSTSKWTTPVHVIANCTGSPATAAILIQGGNFGAFDGIQISRSLFKAAANTNVTINTAGGDTSEDTITVQTDANGHLAGTVGIDMGSFTEAGGYPEHGIVIGHCTDHIYTPGQIFTVRALGVKASSKAPVTFYADAKIVKQNEDDPGYYPDTAYAFSHGDTTVASIVQSGAGSSAVVRIANTAAGSGVVLTGGAFRKSADSAALSLGASGYSWSNVYADTGPWAGSDERLKANIADVDEALMRAWGRVNFKVFQFKDALAEKGEAARLHVGVIAQQVQAAFEAEGLDVTRFGLFGYDSWVAQPAQYNEWDEEIPAEYEEDGTLLTPAHTIHHKEMTSPAIEAGDKYSIRYEEALALECAYQRWELEQIKARIGM